MKKPYAVGKDGGGWHYFGTREGAYTFAAEVGRPVDRLKEHDTGLVIQLYVGYEGSE